MNVAVTVDRRSRPRSQLGIATWASSHHAEEVIHAQARALVPYDRFTIRPKAAVLWPVWSVAISDQGKHAANVAKIFSFDAVEQHVLYTRLEVCGQLSCYPLMASVAPGRICDTIRRWR